MANDVVIAVKDEALLQQNLRRREVAGFVLGARQGAIVTLSGIDGDELRILLDQVEVTGGGRRVLLARLSPTPSADAIVEQLIVLLAETALRLWPIWFTDTSFAVCRDDTLGRSLAAQIARDAAEQIPGLSAPWAEAAARRALKHRPPRVSGTIATVEVGQLAKVISRSGLVLVTEVDAANLTPALPAFVHVLEWAASHTGAAVVALFRGRPPDDPALERILYGARQVDAEDPSLTDDAAPGESDEQRIWIAPWRGLPHPLSETERRLAKALTADMELAPLFGFNQFVDTVRGSRPKVDLVWIEGRLVVELDGYGSHGNRMAFMYDRHRDYELTLSGYTVLRLANDEVAQDVEKAIEKIRDLVKLCRARRHRED